MSTVDSTPCYVETGVKSNGRPSLVFLHGIGGRAFGWEPVMQRCSSAGWHCVAWDMPGYGNSPTVAPYDFPHLAEALGALITQAQLPQPVLIGHSMGGMVAQQYMAQHPHGAKALVLVATSPAFGNGSGEFQQSFLQQRLAPIERGESLSQIAQRLVPTMLGPAATSQATQSAIDCMGSIAPHTYRCSLEALVQFDQRAALPLLTLPTLCLAGELDATAPPKVMSRMAEKIPNANYVCMNGVNHLLPFEQPDQFTHTVVRFLEDNLTYA